LRGLVIADIPRPPGSVVVAIRGARGPREGRSPPGTHFACRVLTFA